MRGGFRLNIERPRLDFPGGMFVAPPTLAHLAPFPLGDLTIEPAIRQVATADGRTVTLEPLVMHVLVALAGADGEPLSRDDLVSACWGRRIVGDDAINRAISHLRRDLGTIGDGSVRIETISKVGYRLVLDRSGKAAEADASQEPLSTPSSPPRRRPIQLAIAAGALACVGGAALAWTGWPDRADDPVTIAIEPAASERGDAVARSLASDLTSDVSRLAGSVTQLSMIDSEIGSTSSDMLVKIGVTRGAQGLTARLRLVDTADGVVIWSRDIRDEQGSPAGLRERTATTIAGVVRCGLGRSAGSFTDPVSLRLFFEACDAVEGGDWAKAKSFAQQIVARHPDDANSLACLAMTTIVSAMEADKVTPTVVRTATGYAEKGLANDLRVGRNYQALALIQASQDKSALAILKQGIEADPNNPSLHSLYALSLFNAGYVKASLDPALRSAALNPGSRHAQSAAVRRLLSVGSTRRAMAMQARIDAAWGSASTPVQDRIAILRFHPDPRAALIAFDRTAEPGEFALERLETEYRINPSPALLARFDALARQEFAAEPLAAWRLASVAIRMGDADRAFAWLAKSPKRQARFVWSGLFSPHAAALRRDPRFFAAMRETGLVELWRRQGRLPDFCREPGLTYDCAIEMARPLPPGTASLI